LGVRENVWSKKFFILECSEVKPKVAKNRNSKVKYRYPPKILK
jgi:hypothetical protein